MVRFITHRSSKQWHCTSFNCGCIYGFCFVVIFRQLAFSSTANFVFKSIFSLDCFKSENEQRLGLFQNVFKGKGEGSKFYNFDLKLAS